MNVLRGNWRWRHLRLTLNEVRLVDNFLFVDRIRRWLGGLACWCPVHCFHHIQRWNISSGWKIKGFRLRRQNFYFIIIVVGNVDHIASILRWKVRSKSTILCSVRHGRETSELLLNTRCLLSTLDRSPNCDDFSTFKLQTNSFSRLQYDDFLTSFEVNLRLVSGIRLDRNI